MWGQKNLKCKYLGDREDNKLRTTEVYMRVDMQVDICVFKVLHIERTVLVNFGRVQTIISSG